MAAPSSASTCECHPTAMRSSPGARPPAATRPAGSRRAPDFRRVASAAADAAAVPAALRHEVFRRIRPVLVRHYARCLSAGTNEQTLADSLTALAIALGIARFEAEYIRSEASTLAVR